MNNCVNCGAPLRVGQKFCENCGTKIEQIEKVEGEVVSEPNRDWNPYADNSQMPYGSDYTSGSDNSANDYNSDYNQQNNTNYDMGYTPKSKMTAGLLAIFLGAFGVHNFYLGYTTKAVIQLVIGIIGAFTCCGIAITGIWGLVEGIMIFTGSINVDGQGHPLGE